MWIYANLTAVELLFDYLNINLRSLYIYIYILDVERGRRWKAASKQHKQTMRRRGGKVKYFERNNFLNNPKYSLWFLNGQRAFSFKLVWSFSYLKRGKKHYGLKVFATYSAPTLYFLKSGLNIKKIVVKKLFIKTFIRLNDFVESNLYERRFRGSSSEVQTLVKTL